MSLLDHFHPPLSSERHWESFHSSWATKIADALTDRWLPPNYIVDVVTTRRANLHNEILGVMEADDGLRLAADVSLYAVAYRPLRRDGKDEIDIWRSPLSLGKPLPELPWAFAQTWSFPSIFRQPTSRPAAGNGSPGPDCSTLKALDSTVPASATSSPPTAAPIRSALGDDGGPAPT